MSVKTQSIPTVTIVCKPLREASDARIRDWQLCTCVPWAISPSIVGFVIEIVIAEGFDIVLIVTAVLPVTVSGTVGPQPVG